MPLGYSVDPNFYQEKAARAGQLIQLLLANQQRREAQRDAQEKEQLNFFFQAAEKDPSLANSMGQSLVEKYGDKYPILPALVSSLQQRQKVLGNIDDATKAFTDQLDKMNSGYQELQQKAAQTPDTLPFHVQVPTLQGGVDTNSPSPWLNQQARDSNASFADTASSLSPGITLQMPNPEKARIMGTLNQVNPAMLPTSALMSLPANQQALVYSNPAVAHMLPKELPNLNDIPLEQRPIVMGQMGLVSPEEMDIAKMHLGAIPKPATIQEQQAIRALEEYKQEQENTRQSDKQDWTDRHTQQEFENQKTIEGIKNTNSSGRIAQQLTGESKLIGQKIQGEKDVAAYKNGIQQGNDGSVTAKSITQTSNQEMTDWMKAYQRESDRISKLKTEDPSQLQAWLNKNPRPVRVPDTISRFIARKVNARIQARPDLADSANEGAAQAVQKYKELMLQPGMTPDKAMSQLFAP